LFKNVGIWLVIALVLMTVFNQFNTRQTAQSPGGLFDLHRSR
jgi:cell division protease FtsH